MAGDLVKGKKVLVTGSSRGIGFAVAQAMLEEGAVVVVNSYEGDPSNLKEWDVLGPFLEKHKGTCHYVGADLSTEEGAKSVVQQAYKILGGLDCLVNNAGTAITGSFTDEDYLEKWMQIQSLNVRGYFIASHEFARLVGQRNCDANIICTGSINAILAERGNVPYDISKAAINGMVRTLANELGAQGIRVNCVAPGLIETDLSRDLLDEPTRRQMAERIPLGRIGMPKDVAYAYVLLASDQASYITGQTLYIDGGIMVRQCTDT